MCAPDGRHMSRDEMVHHLRVERLTLDQRRLTLSKQRAALKDEMNASDSPGRAPLAFCGRPALGINP
jgi:hypothetical protein